jgi:hypothetical protein
MDPSLPVGQRVDDLLSRMTLAEKIGQMTQTERYQVYDDATPITTYRLGSILSGGGSTPAPEQPRGLGRHGRSLGRRRLLRGSGCGGRECGHDRQHYGAAAGQEQPPGLWLHR